MIVQCLCCHAVSCLRRVSEHLVTELAFDHITSHEATNKRPQRRSGQVSTNAPSPPPWHNDRPVQRPPHRYAALAPDTTFLTELFLMAVGRVVVAVGHKFRHVGRNLMHVRV